MRPPRLVAPQSLFTDELWVSIAPIYAAILHHPFIGGLTDGSLPRERFEFYAVQDALYLREFARALAIAGARAPKDDWIVMLTEHAAGALRVERTLHEGFFHEFELTVEAAVATPLAPTTLAYTHYLLAVAYGAPFHEALAALLPCYWIYWEVGKALTRAGSPNPLYARWIGTYGSPEFGAVVGAVLEASVTSCSSARLLRQMKESVRWQRSLHVSDLMWRRVAPKTKCGSSTQSAWTS